jgi:Zn-finger protein
MTISIKINGLTEEQEAFIKKYSGTDEYMKMISKDGLCHYVNCFGDNTVISCCNCPLHCCDDVTLEYSITE